MADDWTADVRRYSPNADQGAIDGIVRYCGIALRNRDSSLVSFGDLTETARVRENFLKKKLGLTEPDAELDAAIASIGERMKGDRTKNRVTVYYLLAERFGKLGLFTKPGATVTEFPGSEAQGGNVPESALGAAGLGTAGLAGASALGASASRMADEGARAVSSAGDTVGGYTSQRFADRPAEASASWRWLLWLLLALLLLGLLFYWLLHRPAPTPTLAPPAPTSEATPAPTPPANAPATANIPTGAGVVSETRNGKPAVIVYFDTGKTDVVPAFGPAAAGLKAYLDAHPGSTLAVSGYNDPTGNAALNAELSKNRAKAVQDALVAADIPAGSITLTKPTNATDTSTTKAQARRVEVVAK